MRVGKLEEIAISVRGLRSREAVTKIGILEIRGLEEVKMGVERYLGVGGSLLLSVLSL